MVFGGSSRFLRATSWPDLSQAQPHQADVDHELVMVMRQHSSPCISAAGTQGCLMNCEAADRAGRLQRPPRRLPRMPQMPRRTALIYAGCSERLAVLKLRAAWRHMLALLGLAAAWFRPLEPSFRFLKALAMAMHRLVTAIYALCSSHSFLETMPRRNAPRARAPAMPPGRWPAHPGPLLHV